MPNDRSGLRGRVRPLLVVLWVLGVVGALILADQRGQQRPGRVQVVEYGFPDTLVLAPVEVEP